VMNADGTTPVNLTSAASAEDQSPTWSPDGTRIAFASKRSGNFDVWEMNADGTGAVNRTSDTAAEDQEPTWSPDGTKIAFASKRSGNFDVWVMNADGSSPANYTSANPQEDYTPDWGGLLAPPTFSATSPPSPANDNDPEILGSAPAGSTVTLYTDAACSSAVAATGSASDFASPGLTVSVADNTTTTFYATATNAGGTSSCSPSSITYTEDSAPPETAITGGPSGPTGDASPTFSFSSTEPGSSFECRVDGGAWAACSSPHTVAPLADGTHTFEVRAIDAAGNADQTPDSVTITVDTPDPQPGDPQPSDPQPSDPQPGGPQPEQQPQRRLTPAPDDLGTISGSLVAPGACQRLTSNVRSRRVRVRGVGVVDVRIRVNTFVTPAEPALVTVRAPSRLRRVRYVLNGRALRGAARAPFKLALRPGSLSNSSSHVLAVRLAPRRGKGRTVKLRLSTTRCRTVFVAQQRRTATGSRLKLRVDSVRALSRISFTVPPTMLPERIANRSVGKLVVRTGGGGRKSYRLRFRGKTGRSLLRAAGAPRVRMGRGKVTVNGLPASTGMIGLTLNRRSPVQRTALPRGRFATLRARVVGAEGVELLSTKLRRPR
jgi:hypothetical protein